MKWNDNFVAREREHITRVTHSCWLHHQEVLNVWQEAVKLHLNKPQSLPSDWFVCGCVWVFFFSHCLFVWLCVWVCLGLYVLVRFDRFPPGSKRKFYLNEIMWPGIPAGMIFYRNSQLGFIFIGAGHYAGTSLSFPERREVEKNKPISWRNISAFPRLPCILKFSKIISSLSFPGTEGASYLPMERCVPLKYFWKPGVTIILCLKNVSFVSENFF